MDTTTPHVVSVTALTVTAAAAAAAAAGTTTTTTTTTTTYGVGDELDLVVAFSHPVVVAGTPTLVLQTTAPGSGITGKAVPLTLNP